MLVYSENRVYQKQNSIKLKSRISTFADRSFSCLKRIAGVDDSSAHPAAHIFFILNQYIAKIMSKTQKHPWFRPRHYLHFDRPVSLAFSESYVTVPDNICTHAFYPFINYILQSARYKKDESSGEMTKATPKQRSISYAAHLDSQIYSYYAFLLAKNYEKTLSEKSLHENIIAFRSLGGKSNIEFARDAFSFIKDMGECDVYGLDVKQFFDTMRHEHLKKMWATVLGCKNLPNDHWAVFKAITQFRTVNRDCLYHLLSIPKNNPKKGRIRVCEPNYFREIVRPSGLISEKAKIGVPQGSPISAILSNVYMLSFDEAMKSYSDSLGGAYYRYCDDILIVVSPGSRGVEEKIEKMLSDIGLEIQAKKTLCPKFRSVDGVLHSDKDLQYLGFMFNGNSIWLRSASLAKYSKKFNKGLRLAIQTMEKANSKRRSRGEATRDLYKNLIYKRYTYFGRRNFISYALKAANIMKSKKIRRQIKPLWNRLKLRIKHATE